MTTFIWILLTTFLISLISFIGALTLFLKERVLNRTLLLLVAFSAGTLLGGAFFHLIPEAIDEIGGEETSLLKIFLYLTSGFCIFFILEQFIGWHHHHSISHPEIASYSYLILVSDALHNFIDGVIIANSFMTDLSIGLVTSFAILFHEIPQEIGDFGVLIYGGVKKSKALFLNFISGLVAILGGITGFYLIKGIETGILFLLPFTAGSFVYIAASDLIPQIKESREIKNSIIHFLAFLSGMAIMFSIKPV